MLSVVLAAFHTALNICGTVILIWFTPQIEKAVCRLIKPQAKDCDDEFRLRYVGGGAIMKAHGLSVPEAQKDIQMFELTDDSLTQMNIMLSGRKDKPDANRSFNTENGTNIYNIIKGGLLTFNRPPFAL